MRNRAYFKSSAVVLVVVALIAVASCKRNDNNASSNPSLTSADDNGGYASDAAKMETTSNDVISITDAAAAGEGSTLRTTAIQSIGCATVNTVTPGVITITFPSSGCVCADGKTRSGQIIVNYTGVYKDSGSQHTITYNNYFVNGNQIKGSKIVTNEGTDTSGQVYYNVSVNDSMVTATGDSVVTWVGNRTRTWLAGYTTTDRSDDVYQISAASPTVLTRANGHSFNFDITSPLYIALNCPYIEAGIVSITGSTIAAARVLNYGTAGSCNPTAQLTIGSTTYTIVIY